MKRGTHIVNDNLKKRVLITGAILNSDASSKDTFRHLNAILGNAVLESVTFEIYSPLDTMHFKGNDFEKYERAINILQGTNVVIAEMSNLSTGQGMELQEAVHLNIPILVIAKTGSKISSLVKGCKNVKDIIYYDNLYDIQDRIYKFLDEELK